MIFQGQKFLTKAAKKKEKPPKPLPPKKRSALDDLLELLQVTLRCRENPPAGTGGANFLGPSEIANYFDAFAQKVFNWPAEMTVFLIGVQHDIHFVDAVWLTLIQLFYVWGGGGGAGT